MTRTETTTNTTPGPKPARARFRRPSGVRADLVAAFLAMALFAAANLVIIWGHWYSLHRIFVWAPPLFAFWHPHVGPGTPIAILLAIAVITFGPRLVRRCHWRVLCAIAYPTGVAWTLAVALVDGWQRGMPSRIASPDEYLVDVPRITNISQFLHGFTSHILAGHPGSWATHVAGHPPGITLIFVWLERIGLGGATAAATACVLVGGLATIAVPITVRALGHDQAARAMLPFLVLLPGPAIAGVSADWLFAGVSATGVALLAIGTTRLRADRPRWPIPGILACLIAGALLAWCVYLSYGLVLFLLIPATVLILARGVRAIAPTVLGAVAVVATFTAAGFWWLDGYHLVVIRYYQDVGFTRPYNYWVWANLACLALITGPAFAAGLHRAAVRAVGVLRRRVWHPDVIVLALTLAAAIIIAIADESGLSKAETERIWLPFAVWLTTATSLIPTRHQRWWLVGQVILALIIKHLLWTQW